MRRMCMKISANAFLYAVYVAVTLTPHAQRIIVVLPGGGTGTKV